MTHTPQDEDQARPNFLLKKVISVCAKADIDTWAQIHPYIIKNIKSEIYEVIVPDSDLTDFQNITHSSITVIPESSYIDSQTINDLEKIVSSKIKGRFGWYLQQLLKMQAAHVNLDDDDIILIWDADALPLKELKFLNEDGSLNYYTGLEYHQPYFETLKQLIGINKQVSKSFISQCLPTEVKWVKGFCALIESNHKKNWMYAICECVNGASISEFSEYESIGSYIYYTNKNLVRFQSSRWYRWGGSLFGFSIRSLDKQLKLFSKYYDFVAFEKWDSVQYKGINIGCGNQRLEETYLGNKMLNSDIDDLPAADIVFDCNDPEWFLSDDQFEHIVINNVIEHCDSVMNVMSELNRILKQGGILQFEIPFVGSFNHGTDVTHKRGFTFDSFNFLFNKENYLYRYGDRNPFNFKLIQFWRENIIGSELSHDTFDFIPQRIDTFDWVRKVKSHEIPGTFGFVFQKL